MTILALQFVSFVITFSRLLVNDPHNPRPAPLLGLDLSKICIEILFKISRPAAIGLLGLCDECNDFQRFIRMM